MSKSLLDDGHALGLDVRHVGECALEVELVALGDDLVLVRLLPVLGVDFAEENVEVGLGGELAEGREALVVEEGVVREVDENLRGARVGSRGREGDPTLGVALVLGIIRDVGAILVHFVNLGGPLQAPLHNEIIGIAEETRAIVEVVHHKAVEAIRALRGPVAVHKELELSDVGGESALPLFRRLQVHARVGSVRKLGRRLAGAIKLSDGNWLSILCDRSSSHQAGWSHGGHVKEGNGAQDQRSCSGEATNEDTFLHRDS
mmetsp:Transcript_25069/g.50234  ORF Transcript_25069/g.50234 Transcript_25069/m.50234 type:complete len:260 (-) Transcript_25069:2-781(-)